MLEMILLLTATILHVLDRSVYYAQLVVFHLLICIRNARKLYSLLVSGTKTWIYMLCRLLMFTILLAPGWYHLLRYWFFDSFILRNIEYGRGSKYRNVMDIYLPLPMSVLSQLRNDAKAYPDGAPVVVFVSGGAWIIGYKLWSALVGRALACFGILTVVPDYRNFPQGDIKDMTEDIRNAITWTEANATRFGGNPDKIVLAGQSAGAHICLCLLVEEYLDLKRCHDPRNDYQEKLSMNYHLFDEMISKSKEASQIIHGSDKLVAHNSNKPPAELVSPSRVKIAEDVEEDSSSSERSEGGDEDGEEDVETPYFKHYSIYPIKERKSMDGMETGHDNDEVSSQPPSNVDKVSTMTWFSDPFQDASLGLNAKEDKSHLKESLEGNVLSAVEEENGDVWREVSDEDLLFSTLENSEREPEQIFRPDPMRLDANIFAHNSAAIKTPRPSPSKRSPHFQRRMSKLQAKVEHRHRKVHRIWDKVKLFIGVSGPYNLHALEAHLHKRGLDSSILHWICRGNLIDSSPTVQLQQFVLQQLSSDKTETYPIDKGTRAHVPVSNTTTTAAAFEVTAVATATDDLTAEANVSPSLVSVLPPARGNATAQSSQVFLSTERFTAVSVSSSAADRCSENPTNNDSSSKNWSLVNFLQSEVNLYFQKLFSPNQLVNFQFLAPSPQINSNDDVLLGLNQGLSSRQLDLLQSSSALLDDFLPVALFHGAKDVSIPSSISEELAGVLSHHGAKVSCKVYSEWNHTDAILEAPLYGNTQLFKDMIRAIRHATEGTGRSSAITRRPRAASFPGHSSTTLSGLSHRFPPPANPAHSSDDKEATTKDLQVNPSEVPLAPKVLLDLGRRINPF